MRSTNFGLFLLAHIPPPSNPEIPGLGLQTFNYLVVGRVHVESPGLIALCTTAGLVEDPFLRPEEFGVLKFLFTRNAPTSANPNSARKPFG